MYTVALSKGLSTQVAPSHRQKIQNIALDVIQYNSFSYNAAYVALNNNEILESNSRPIYGCKTYFKIHVSN